MAVMVSSPRLVYPSAVKNLGYVGAHGGLAQAESFGDNLVRQRLDEQVERGA